MKTPSKISICRGVKPALVVRMTGLSKAGVEAGVGYLISRDCDSKARLCRFYKIIKNRQWLNA